MRAAVKVGDFVKVHGYIGEVTEVHDNGFWYETENDGERIFYQFDWTIDPQLRTCWILEQ